MPTASDAALAPEPPLNVVMIAAEGVPFSKTGGLADVVGALPRALETLGHRCSIILPCHRSSWNAGIPIGSTGRTVQVPIDRRFVEATIREAVLPGSDVRVFLIDQPSYFDREGLYQRHGVDYQDNCERFVFFCRAALETIRLLDLRPDVIHCHDWQAGLVPVYLAEEYRARFGGPFEAVGTLMTVHNLAYQGSFWPIDMPLTGLGWHLFDWRRLEAFGSINFLKAGLVYSDLLSTVSPTYAREIQGPERGCGLDGLLRSRAGDLHGIVNGIDPHRWNPRVDPVLAARYDINTVVEGKAACKAQLQRRASLPERPDVPLFAQIGRLDPQKGWDLLAAVVDELLNHDVQLIILGEGLPRYHELLDRLGDIHPGKLRPFLTFNDVLAHQIEAGADVFLMPSLYEPCGLNQLYSLAYGTVPIVRATGGLADTVVDAAPRALAEDRATGFVFGPPTARALEFAIGRALGLWPARDAWLRLMRNGMSRDWSWTQSARRYVRLYREIHRRRHPRP